MKNLIFEWSWAELCLEHDTDLRGRDRDVLEIENENGRSRVLGWGESWN